MTPAEIEERFHRQEGAIGVLKALLIDLVGLLPPGPRAEIQAGMAVLATAFDTMAKGAVGEVTEMNSLGAASFAREMSAAFGSSPVRDFSKGGKINFGGPQPSDD
jgi:hypothetical protein